MLYFIFTVETHALFEAHFAMGLRARHALRSDLCMQGFAMTRRLLHARHCTETESWSALATGKGLAIPYEILLC